MHVAIVGSDAEARLALVTALDVAPATWSLSLHREPPADADVIVCDPGAAIPGAIVFDGDTVGLIEQITTSTRAATAVVVTSPSGGTGVTSVALHLAAEFATRQRATCLVDLDTKWGVRPRLGLEPQDDPTPAPVPVAAGFRLLHGAKSLATALDTFERVVIDAPPLQFQTMAETVGAGVLVAVPTPEGARRARCFLDAHPTHRWVVVTNRVGPGGEMTRARFERAIDMPVVELPCCAALRDTEDHARLLARGWTRWSRAIAKLATSLDDD
jgi:hypothetical protein